MRSGVRVSGRVWHQKGKLISRYISAECLQVLVGHRQEGIGREQDELDLELVAEVQELFADGRLTDLSRKNNRAPAVLVEVDLGRGVAEAATVGTAPGRLHRPHAASGSRSTESRSGRRRTANNPGSAASPGRSPGASGCGRSRRCPCAPRGWVSACGPCRGTSPRRGRASGPPPRRCRSCRPPARRITFSGAKVGKTPPTRFGMR